MSWLCSLSCSPSNPTWVNEYIFWMCFDIWWMLLLLFILLISENWEGADVELLRMFFLIWVLMFWGLEGFVVLDMKSWGFERFVFEDNFKELICWRMVTPLEFICKFGCCCCCLVSLFMLGFGLMLVKLGGLLFKLLLLFKLVILLFKLLLLKFLLLL